MVPVRRSTRTTAGVPPRRLQPYDLRRSPERRYRDQHSECDHIDQHRECDQIISADVHQTESVRPIIVDIGSENDIQVSSNGKFSPQFRNQATENEDNEQLVMLEKQMADVRVHYSDLKERSDKMISLNLNRKTFQKAQCPVQFSTSKFNSPQRASTPLPGLMTAPVRSRVVVTPVRSQTVFSCDTNVGRRMSASSCQCDEIHK